MPWLSASVSMRLDVSPLDLNVCERLCQSSLSHTSIKDTNILSMSNKSMSHGMFISRVNVFADSDSCSEWEQMRLSTQSVCVCVCGGRNCCSIRWRIHATCKHLNNSFLFAFNAAATRSLPSQPLIPSPLFNPSTMRPFRHSNTLVSLHLSRQGFHS